MNPARVLRVLAFALAGLAVLIFAALKLLSLKTIRLQAALDRFGREPARPGLSDELAPPLLNHAGLAIALEPPQHQHPVPHVRQDRLVELRQQRSAQRIPWRHELRHQVARVTEAQVVSAEIAFE
jgi:hypothetical protein